MALEYMERSMSNTPFLGPLFIVGMSRSGTKLIRDILNRNPMISIPTRETKFIPYLINRFGGLSFPLDESLIVEIKAVLRESLFVRNMRKNGWVFCDSELDSITARSSLQEVIKYLLQFSADKSKKEADFIWGDKSPSNLTHIGLLKSFFPDAKIIHIIRDPRDRALSAKKAWGANLYISCDQWRKDVVSARYEGENFESDYYEVFYEKLISNPRHETKNLCEYLGVPFRDFMLNLKSPVEGIHAEKNSETKTSTRIVSTNKDKYLKQLKSSQIRRMNQIIYPVIHEMGYGGVKEQHDIHAPLVGLEKALCMIADRYNKTCYAFKRCGFLDGIHYLQWLLNTRLK